MLTFLSSHIRIIIRLQNVIHYLNFKARIRVIELFYIGHGNGIHAAVFSFQQTCFCKLSSCTLNAELRIHFKKINSNVFRLKVFLKLNKMLLHFRHNAPGFFFKFSLSQFNLSPSLNMPIFQTTGELAISNICSRHKNYARKVDNGINTVVM